MFTFTATGTEGLTGRLTRFQFLAVANVWADEIEPLVLAELKRHAPVRTGQFRNSIRARRHMTGTGLAIHFVSDVEHAKYIVGGTRPHIIRPVRAKALHWVDPSGRDRFARLVHHPGTKPNPFARRAMQPLVPLVAARLSGIVSARIGGR